MQNQNNTYSGGTNVTTVGGNGQLQVNTSDVYVNGTLVSGPLGTGPVNLTAGVFQNGNSSGTVSRFEGTAVTLHNAFNFINANTIIGAGNAGAGGDINLAGPVTVTGNTNTISVSAFINFTLSGVVSGTGALTKINSGTMTLNNPNNTFSGGVTVSAGNLVMGGSTARQHTTNTITSGPLGTGI